MTNVSREISDRLQDNIQNAVSYGMSDLVHLSCYYVVDPMIYEGVESATFMLVGEPVAFVVQKDVVIDDLACEIVETLI